MKSTLPQYHFWIELKAFDSINQRFRNSILINFKDKDGARDAFKMIDDHYMDEFLQQCSDLNPRPMR